jgi:copper(I)-binding protein
LFAEINAGPLDLSHPSDFLKEAPMHRSIFRLALLLSASAPYALFAANTALTVVAPYVRLAPPGASATGAFMLIRNSGSTDRKLVKATSPAARTAELHNHINENGVMKMREVQSIDINANGQIELKPGSYHIMLIGMKNPLKEGDTVPITLTFDDGRKKQIAAPVRALQTTMPAGMDMKHGEMPH